VTDIQALLERLEASAAFGRERVAATVRQMGRDCDEAATVIRTLLAREAAMREALDDGVATLAAVRATASGPDWAECADHFSALCKESIVKLNGALKASPPLPIPGEPS